MLLYNITIRLLILGIRILSRFKKKEKRLREGQDGVWSYLEEHVDRTTSYIWIHAASLGEFEQGRPIIEAIKKENPCQKILLTFFSPSGYEVRKNYPLADLVTYLPYDLPSNSVRFLSAVPIKCALFIKYEVWGNYLRAMKKRDIPVHLVSAIFRKDQLFFKSYGRIYRNFLFLFESILVQNETSKLLLEEIGYKDCEVIGDTRFDRVIDVMKQAKPIFWAERFASDPHKKVIVAGSSWQTDEDFLIPYFNEHPQVKLIIAPHEIHSDHISSIISKLKRPFICYTMANEKNINEVDCLIMDCFGLLSSVYRYGDLAYIGGGFGAGIHNTLEAAVYGIPVIFGKKYHKFREAKELIACGGGYSIPQGDHFISILDQIDWEVTGAKAGEYVLHHAGATQKVMNRLFLNSKDSKK